jgi:PAS domain S-box-containing protein
MGKETIKTKEQLLLEIEYLRSQLSQAEDTINAIRNGEVDAIIVSGSSGEKVFSLASSETPYRMIIEEMDEGAVTVSSSGIILYSNLRFSEIVSTPPEQIPGSDFSRFIEAGDRWEFRRLLNAGLKRKVRGVVSSRLNGKKVTLQLSLVALPPNMEGDICIVVSDITEITNYQNYLQEMVEERSSKLKEANRQLSEDIEMLRKAEEQLLELNAAKDKFFSIITHDLKSPFTSIIGFSELLIEKIQVNDYNDVKEFANIIHNSSWRAMDLLTNLIEWSRLQTGRMEFNPEKINIISVINEVTEFLNVSALEKSIEIEKDIPVNINVFADKPMVSTVLRNLLSNAVKFTRPKGKIVVSAFKEYNTVVVSVCDNGIGIKKEIIEKLFSIGETISTKGTTGEEGTGLGLLLVKDFVMKHGGEIRAESEIDKGSKFIFTLPLFKEHIATDEKLQGKL